MFQIVFAGARYETEDSPLQTGQQDRSRTNMSLNPFGSSWTAHNNLGRATKTWSYQPILDTEGASHPYYNMSPNFKITGMRLKFAHKSKASVKSVQMVRFRQGWINCGFGSPRKYLGKCSKKNGNFLWLSPLSVGKRVTPVYPALTLGKCMFPKIY